MKNSPLHTPQSVIRRPYTVDLWSGERIQTEESGSSIRQLQSTQPIIPMCPPMHSIDDCDKEYFRNYFVYRLIRVVQVHCHISLSLIRARTTSRRPIIDNNFLCKML